MTENWAEMSADERRDARIAEWRAAEGVPFESPEAEATYRAGVDRFRDVLAVTKEPDRVPIMLNATFMPANLYGVSPHTMMYEPEVLTSTFGRFLADYRPDYYFTPAIIGSGQVLEILDYKQYAWPGHGVSEESGYQYVESEYMLDRGVPGADRRSVGFLAADVSPAHVRRLGAVLEDFPAHGSVGDRPRDGPHDPVRRS